MNLNDILNLDMDTLQEEKLKALKNHVICVLSEVIEKVKAEDFQSIYDKLEYSPAGDGYGCNNHFIDFKWEGAPDIRDGYDLGDLLEEMSKLKGIPLNDQDY